MKPLAHDLDFQWGRLGGGLTFYPYQIALGFSIRYWKCIFAPSIRIHIGPFKFWAYLSLKGKHDGTTTQS